MPQPLPSFKASSSHHLCMGAPLTFAEALCNSEGRLKSCYQSFSDILNEKKKKAGGGMSIFTVDFIFIRCLNHLP